MSDLNKREIEMRKVLIATAIAATLGFGFSVMPASAQMGCSPYVGGQCGQDLYRGIFANIGGRLAGMLGRGGIARPYGYGYGYGRRPAYRGYPDYARPMVVHYWCRTRFPDGRTIVQPGRCPIH